ncbi:MAG: type II secretion system minor pseudopilin GspJ [Steroidobacteraceae bacterium]
MKSRNSGFTLVELLVALFITAILFAMGYGAMRQAIDNREGIELRQARLVQLQRAMRTLVQDFAQFSPRPVRDVVGTAFEPALLSATTSGAVATLTRAGWSNPAGVQRATLQRVRYVFAEGKLRRDSFPVLDAVADVKPRSQDLLSDVKSISFRFMTDGGNWIDAWPPPSSQDPPEVKNRLRPEAVEVTLDLSDWGKLVRIIEVGY